MVSKMNIGKGRAKANIEKLAGTHRQVGKNLRDMELGGHEATLYKIDTTRFYNNGWICVLKDTGEEVEAFNTFEPYERVLPLGELGQGVINFTPPVEVLLLQDRNGDEWHIIRGLDKKDIQHEPGEKVFENGQSRFSIKEGIVELTTPKFVLDADIIEGIEISGSEGPPGPEGKGYFGLTSLSSITIGTGSKTFIVNQAQGTNAFAVGDQIRIKYNTSNYMDGIVTSYSGTSFVANISNYVGSGTYATWTIGITGTKGNDGAEGPQGPQGEPASQENIDDRITTLVWDYYPAFVDDRITAADIPSMIQTAINNAEEALIEMIVPVGTIITSADGTNPGTRIPGTTWVAEAQGKFILGVGGSYTNGATGGAETVTLVVNNLPSHKHNVAITSSGAHTSGAPSNNSTDSSGASTSGSGGSGDTGGTAPSTNSSGAHNHILKMKLHGASGTARYNVYASGDYESSGAVQSGGEHNHTVNSHTHTIPAHTHTTPAHSHSLSNHTHQVQNHTHTVTEDNIGSAAPISIMPPYIARYMWRRTA